MSQFVTHGSKCREKRWDRRFDRHGVWSRDLEYAFVRSKHQHIGIGPFVLEKVDLGGKREPAGAVQEVFVEPATVTGAVRRHWCHDDDEVERLGIGEQEIDAGSGCHSTIGVGAAVDSDRFVNERNGARGRHSLLEGHHRSRFGTEWDASSTVQVVGDDNGRKIWPAIGKISEAVLDPANKGVG